MSTLSDLVYAQGRSTDADVEWLHRLAGDGQLLADLAFADIVINDEAHHAYRKPAESKVSRKEAEALGIDLEEATRWVEGLDRIHKMRRISRCFDL